MTIPPKLCYNNGMEFKANIQPLVDKEQTGRVMYWLVDNFHNDLDKIAVKRNGEKIPLSGLPFDDYFDIVRKIPYRRDTEPVEVTARPLHIWNLKNLGMDCKKKAIMMGAYFHDKLPYRFMSTSAIPSGEIHHVFPQVKIEGDWYNMDATYPSYVPFQIKKVTNFQALSRD